MLNNGHVKSPTSLAHSVVQKETYVIIIIMFLKGSACFLFLDPQDEVGPSISSSVVLRFFVLLVYILVLVLVVCLCPSSVHVVATFPCHCFMLAKYLKVKVGPWYACEGTDSRQSIAPTQSKPGIRRR